MSLSLLRLTVAAIPAISGAKMVQEQPILIISCGIILG
jgi:hypothetical protein